MDCLVERIVKVAKEKVCEEKENKALEKLKNAQSEKRCIR